MPLSPAPVLPGTSPLTPPGQQPPNRRAQRAAVVISGVTLVVLLGLGQVLLPRLVFLAPGLQAQAQVSLPGEGGTSFQGFQFPWDRTRTGGGYDNTASLQNMQSQASVFHLNAVIIPVVADVPDSIDGHVSWNAADHDNRHTLSDDQYTKAIDDALKAGLAPILELQLRALDQTLGDNSGSAVGNSWGGLTSDASIGLSSGAGQGNIGDLEKKFFDDYTAFAVHYAKMSADHNLPYFIIGDGLTSVTYDMPPTSWKGDPAGRDRSPAGDPPCTQNIGRRDCSWRHVINAIKKPGYPKLQGGTATGASYKGKLIYAASWSGASVGWSKASEFDHITWWDAVDYIGVDANFPLTQNQGAPSVQALADAWHGKGDPATLGGQSDIYGRLEKVTDTYHRPIVFTSVEYDSAFGASSGQPQAAEQDNGEQLHDMEALLSTFSGTSWWVGVFWYADYPIAPRIANQPNWAVLGNWAGDNIDNSKDAGKWLAQYYKPNPIKCDCTP